MRDQLASLFKLGKNGAELPTAKATELDAPLFPDPGNHFAKAVPDAGVPTLMKPVGPHPRERRGKGHVNRRFVTL